MEVMHQLQQDKRDWTAANDAIDRAAQTIAKDSKESVQPVLLRAEILAIQNKINDAEKLLNDANTAHPDRVEFWTALADLAGRRKQEHKSARNTRRSRQERCMTAWSCTSVAPCTWRRTPRKRTSRLSMNW